MNSLKFYLETSVWSRLMDRADPVRRRITRAFLAWAEPRHYLYTSRLVLLELQKTKERDLRRQALRKYRSARKRVIPTVLRVRAVALELIDQGCVTANHLADAVHLAYALVAGVDGVVTWNLKDLARPHTRKVVRDYCRRRGMPHIRIASPIEVARWLHVRIE